MSPMPSMSAAGHAENRAAARASPEDPGLATRGWILAGHLVVFGLLGGLVAWSALTTISGAVVAPGTVIVEGNNKSVQHQDGGIVAEIFVRNGRLVQSGDLILRLNDSMPRANYSVIRSRLNDALAHRARLEAERDRREAITWPAELIRNVKSADVERHTEPQQRLFEARLKARLGEEGVLRQRIAQLDDDVAGQKAQLTARKEEEAITGRDLAAAQQLRENGYASETRLNVLKRELARLQGEIGRISSEIARTRGQMSEVELKIAQNEKEFTQTVVDELRRVQAAINELGESRAALEDKLNRIEIRAPYTGRVHGLQVHTVGGVVQPGATLMLIVPENDPLIVEAQVAPNDIEQVKRGQDTRLRFTSFNQRTTPQLSGMVSHVAPAQTQDSGTGRAYFQVQVQIPPEEHVKLGGGRLIPGMPAEVYIETQSRTVISYFVKPLSDAWARALRER